MPNRIDSTDSLRHSSGKSTSSSNSLNQSMTSISIWILRIILFIILLLFIMPIALLLTPWWISMQPFERACPNMMNGYYRIVTWPLKISKNIRFYRTSDQFIQQLKY
ncbi:unnamed protein product [Rotaria sp. Silwood1]|nr:unnamed protein product [Rotaria sp. Silwood1]CAF3343392.1 unnamed protein product [Rotaria sp. Silwood1]CAF4626813.1 unnamed protein product [Rotaria sp. Silwood1]CAF4862073.1 unnamed protein product [Rotaria sp. Silwood1]